jgi:hypothetical protein
MHFVENVFFLGGPTLGNTKFRLPNYAKTIPIGGQRNDLYRGPKLTVLFVTIQENIDAGDEYQGQEYGEKSTMRTYLTTLLCYDHTIRGLAGRALGARQQSCDG